MKQNDRQMSIKCQCIVVKNNIEISTKKKSKFSQLILDEKQKVIKIVPFGSNKAEDIVQFSLLRLKSVMKRYIQEGKITLQFVEKSTNLNREGQEIVSSILVSSASKENLELFLTKISSLKRQNMKENKKEGDPSQKPVKRKMPESIQKSKQEQKDLTNYRKEMRKAIMNPQANKKLQIKKKEPSISFFQLPFLLLSKIFQYNPLRLEQRSISRQLSDYILKKIKYIKVRDEVDEKSFNLLCKWAVNVDCRMKNVKNLVLYDQYDDQELIKNRAKSLRFSAWKQMTTKNAQQLKGLRIYCLELPYMLKYDLSHLFGLRLVELRLKSPQIITVRNDYIKNEDLLYLLKNVKDLRVLELSYMNSNLLTNKDFPFEKMEELTITYLSDNAKEGQKWTDFSKWEKLKVFGLDKMDRLGKKKENNEVDFLFPDCLENMTIGPFCSFSSFEKLPISITHFKTIGENYFNNLATKVKIFQKKLYLPNLRVFDLTESPNIRSEVLEFMQDVTLKTSWSRDNIELLSKIYCCRGIVITTNK